MDMHANRLVFLQTQQKYDIHGLFYHSLTLYPPSAAYTRRWAGSALIQVMACRLFGAKPLPELMLVYCQLDP